MAPDRVFGGNWTEEELDLLSKYLAAYVRIFTVNRQAKFFHTVYVDAFAGTGHIRRAPKDTDQFHLFDELSDDEALEYMKGSAVRALELDPGFKEYLFIERDPQRARELECLKQRYPGKKITVRNAEANEYLKSWCSETDWRKTRAVIFLDPYGMQVEWSLVKQIAETQGVDLWWLFPLGAAVMRLLKKQEPPPQSWANRVTAIVGTRDWEKEFYKPRESDTLFGAAETNERAADYEAVTKFLLKRLRSVFERVAGNPYVLKNSKNCPLYLFCFAAGNPKGAPIAVKIAQDIMKS